MTPIPRPLTRALILSLSFVTLFVITFLFRNQRVQSGAVTGSGFQFRNQRIASHSDNSNKRISGQITEQLDLDEEQCKASFPGLTQDVDNGVKRGKFMFNKSDPDYQGLVQGRILNGKLHVITTSRTRTPEILHQRTSILQQIHRALLTSPTTLPNTHFAFVVNDVPKNDSWVFAKPNKQVQSDNENANMWLMPHFEFWAWAGKGKTKKETEAGRANMRRVHSTMDGVLHRIQDVEWKNPWDKKIDKVVWRGTPWFNPIGHPSLRQNLLKASKSSNGRNKEWADIEALHINTTDRGGGTYSNSLAIEDFCRYKYIIYTDGVTYSGRLPYHQACQSVLLMAPLGYLTVTAWYVRPILAEDLMAAFSDKRNAVIKASGKTLAQEPQKSQFGSGILPLIRTVTDYRLANAIYLAPTFANLEPTIDFLRSHSHVAEKIARNQRDSIHGKGYLSSGAETCYWRALIRGWASVAISNSKDWGEDEGERFEDWVVKQISGVSQ